MSAGDLFGILRIVAHGRSFRRAVSDFGFLWNFRVRGPRPLPIQTPLLPFEVLFQ